MKQNFMKFAGQCLWSKPNVSKVVVLGVVICQKGMCFCPIPIIEITEFYMKCNTA